MPAEAETALQAHVLSLAAPLLLQNAELCPQPRPFSGLVTTTIGDWRPEHRAGAHELLEAGHRARVWIVAADTPAAHAGLQAGDMLIRVNGRWSQPSARWNDDLHTRILPAAMRRGPVRLELDRRGESVELTLHPEPACAGHVRIVGQQASAWISDGTLYVGRAFALAAPDGMLQQHFALALARHVNGYRPGSALLARGRQADSLVRFAFGVDAVQSLAGRGPESTPPRWRAPSPAETALAAQMLERAGVYASPSLPDSPASPASPAASGPEGACGTGSTSSVQP